MTWVIEVRFNPNQEWRPVDEKWWKDIRNARVCGIYEPMKPRTLEECSEKAVESRERWHSYEEGSMRMRNMEDGEIIPFEIFT